MKIIGRLPKVVLRQRDSEETLKINVMVIVNVKLLLFPLHTKLSNMEDSERIIGDFCSKRTTPSPC